MTTKNLATELYELSRVSREHYVAAAVPRILATIEANARRAARRGETGVVLQIQDLSDCEIRGLVCLELDKQGFVIDPMCHANSASALLIGWDKSGR